MKLFRYIFILFIISLIIFAVWKINSNNQTNNNTDNILLQESNILVEELNLSITNLDTLNPLLSKNKNVYDISSLIFEPLIEVDNNFKLKPCLAKEWSAIDNTTYIIKLDKNALWSDNMSFISKDVVFTIEKLKQIDSLYKSNVENIINTEIIDDNTIRIFLKEPDPFFEYNLTFPILPSHYYYNEDFVKTKRNPIGTGPYKIAEIDTNSITLKKNSNYVRNNSSKFSTINIMLYDSIGRAYTDFKSRKIDALNVTSLNYEDVIGSIGYSKLEYIGRELDILALNLKSGIIKNKEVRQVLNMVIDKERIISEVFSNKKIISNFILPPNNYLYNESLLTSKFNVSKAKQLLFDNGWKVESNVWKKEKQKLNLTLLINSSNENNEKVAQIIKKDLEDVNINITIKKLEKTSYKKALNNKEYDIALLNITTSLNPDLSIFLKGDNYSNYNNNEVDNLLSGTGDIKDRYDKIQEIFNDECPYIPLYYSKNILVYNEKIQGDNYTTWNNVFRGIQTWEKRIVTK